MRPYIPKPSATPSSPPASSRPPRRSSPPRPSSPPPTSSRGTPTSPSSRSTPSSASSPASPLPSPDHLSFPFALSASVIVAPSPGLQLHALLFKNALFRSDHYVTTALLQLHAPRPDDARRVFDELPRREAIHYDLVIGAYARGGMATEGLALFRAMFLDGVRVLYAES